jgi:hypothetical protein
MIALVVMQDAIDPPTAHATDRPMTVLAKHEPSPAARFAARRIMRTTTTSTPRAASARWSKASLPGGRVEGHLR